MHPYYPYICNDGKHKYYIYTLDGKIIKFGDINYDDYTTHKNDKRKLNYIKRHEKNEKWDISGIDTPGFWSKNLLWDQPTLEESYKNIKKKYLSKLI